MAWNNANIKNIGNGGFGDFNLKSKGTWNIGNVRNISNVDFFISKSEGHVILVILGILVILASEILISKGKAVGI